MTLLKKLSIAIFCLLLASCTGSRVTEVIQSSHNTPDHKSILVVGNFRNDTNRNLFEDSIVEQLKGDGIQADQSYKNGTELSKESILASVKENGYTMVIVTTLRAIQRRDVYLPSDLATVDEYYGNMLSYFDYTHSEVSKPFPEQLSTVTLETSVYNVESHQILLSVSTVTDDPRDVASKAKGLAKKLIRTFKKYDIL